jgi:hypothetical protein
MIQIHLEVKKWKNQIPFLHKKLRNKKVIKAANRLIKQENSEKSLNLPMIFMILKQF